VWDLRAASPCTASFVPAAPRSQAPPLVTGGPLCTDLPDSAAQSGLSAVELPAGSLHESGLGALPDGMLTCCSWDVTGHWLVAGCRGGILSYYCLTAGSVAASMQLPHTPMVRVEGSGATGVRARVGEWWWSETCHLGPKFLRAPKDLAVLANEVYVGVDAPVLCHSAFMAPQLQQLPISVPCTTALACEPRHGSRMGLAVLGSLYGSLHVLDLARACRLCSRPSATRIAHERSLLVALG